jgi:hypothetical protein
MTAACQLGEVKQRMLKACDLKKRHVGIVNPVESQVPEHLESGKKNRVHTDTGKFMSRA